MVREGSRVRRELDRDRRAREVRQSDYLHAMRRHALSICAIAAALSVAACGRSASSKPATAAEPEPLEHALSGLSAQHIAVLPTYAVRVMPGLSWGGSVECWGRRGVGPSRGEARR